MKYCYITALPFVMLMHVQYISLYRVDLWVVIVLTCCDFLINLGFMFVCGRYTEYLKFCVVQHNTMFFVSLCCCC